MVSFKRKQNLLALDDPHTTNSGLLDNTTRGEDIYEFAKVVPPFEVINLQKSCIVILKGRD